MKKKMCQKCGEIKFVELDFYRHRNNKDGYRNDCKPCASKDSSERYLKDRKLVKAKRETKRLEKRETLKSFVKEYLSASCCTDCLNTDWRVLEFDHVRGEKKYNIGDLMKGTFSLDTFLAEVDKCDVVCANCHRIRTYERAGHWRIEEEAS